jgi:hypothetical protein
MLVANPDFVARLKTNAAMNEVVRASFLGGAAQAYVELQAAWSANRWISQAAAGPGGVSVRYIAWKA